MLFGCREAQATFHMVEMYLYPEIEMLWAQAEQGYSPDHQPLQANMEAVNAAQKLLGDVHVSDDNMLQHKVCPGYQVLKYNLPSTLNWMASMTPEGACTMPDCCLCCFAHIVLAHKPAKVTVQCVM